MAGEGCPQRAGRRPLRAAVIVIAAGVLATATAAQPARRTADHWPWPVDRRDLDPSVPTPESVIGHEAGAGAVRHEPLIAYLAALAEASPLVTLTTYATSHEGRELHYATITSAENHERLEEIRAATAKLADPRTLRDEAEAAEIIEHLPATAWLAYSIHGDELSPCDAAMQVIYLLAAGTDKRTAALRDELVIHVDPIQNPDGRERYLAQLQTLQGRVPNGDYQAMQHAGLWSAGRGNHYLFDLNRDWLAQVHPETRGRSAAILRWNPQFLVDAHEMSGLDTYLFDPPREPINVSLGETLKRWRQVFSADQARAFDGRGWSYYTREWYEEWYPGYTNAWSNLLGAVGLLYEAPGLNSAAVTQETGQVMTYAEAVHRNVVGTFANLHTMREHRGKLLRDYLADRRWAVSAEGPFNRVFLVPPAPDRSRRARLLDVLDLHGIEHTVAAGGVEAEDVVDVFGRHRERAGFPPGTVIIRPQQPHRRLMHAVLGFDPRMSEAFLLDERRELENRRPSRLYDVTAWNLPMAFGLDVREAATVSVAAGPGRAARTERTPALDEGGYGYLIDGADGDVAVALVRLFEAGARPRVATRPFTVAGRAYEPGSVLLRRHEQPSDARRVLDDLAGQLTVDVRAVDSALSDRGPDLGGRRFPLFHEPRVAIASQWPISTTSFGATWHLLDHRLGLRVSPVNAQRLGGMDLRKYNVIILPGGYGAGALGAVIDRGARQRLRQWVQAGGTLIAYGSSAVLLADPEDGLSSVRLRRDALADLPVYAEALQRERAARAVTVDPQSVWSSGPPAGDGAAATEAGGGEKGQRRDLEALERLDRWQRTFSPRGVFLAAETDPLHWLCGGVSDRLPVLMSGSSAFMSRRPVQTAVRLADAGDLRLSGLLWPEARERLAGTAYLTRESMGRGQIILFAGDPFSRGYLEGTGRLLTNAVLLGPGAGADQGVPW